MGRRNFVRHRNMRKSSANELLHRKKQWQKVLYGNEDYPDNYTDPMFLKDLQKNINVQIFKYSEASLGATKLTHQLSVIVVFLLIYYNLNKHPPIVSAEFLLLAVCCITFIGYIIFSISNRFRPSFNHTSDHLTAMRDDIKTVVCVFVFGFVLSPMLHTLTKSISTDTIYTITCIVFFVHVMCYDYGMPAALVSRAISLNAAIFGTICLASRLATSLDAFVLLIVAVTLFAIYPNFVRSLETSSKKYLRLAPVILFTSAACYGLLTISPILFCINGMVVIFCGFIYPFIFCYAQKYKNNIHGPWDEAVVDINVS